MGAVVSGAAPSAGNGKPMIARFVYAFRYFRRDLGLPLGRALRSAWREARRGR